MCNILVKHQYFGVTVSFCRIQFVKNECAVGPIDGAATAVVTSIGGRQFRINYSVWLANGFGIITLMYDVTNKKKR